MKRRRSKIKRSPVPPIKRSKDRRLVRIDQGPLRQKAASECRQMLAKVEKARLEWKRFEREDQPAFGRWLAANFGQLLTELRELESRALEKETLVELVEEEMMFGGGSPQRAYDRVMKRRANPSQEHDETDPGDEPPPDGPDFEERNSTEEADREMFEDAISAFMGIDPDQLDQATYDRMFREFREQVLGEEDSDRPSSADRPSAAKKPSSDETRIKEIYRVLVRRLHPDLRADQDAGVSALWHEVQEAYEAGNLDRLETLLALTDLESNRTGAHTSLFQLKSVLAELGRSLRALQKSLRGARREPAWNFARITDHTEVRNRMRRELESSRSELKARLSHVEAILADWSRPPSGSKRKAGRSSRSQEEFRF